LPLGGATLGIKECAVARQHKFEKCQLAYNDQYWQGYQYVKWHAFAWLGSKVIQADGPP